jgi:hypothetical protein
MDPLPTVAKAFSIVQQQERNQGNVVGEGKFVQNISTTSWKSNNMNKGKSKSNPCKPNNQSKICSFCGKENHSVDNCFFKNGFPTNYKFKNKQTASVNSVSTKDSTATSSGNASQPNLILSNKDYAMLADMLKKIKLESNDHSVNSITHNTTTHHDNMGNLSNSFWIIDSGATDHVCNDLNHFSSIKEICPIAVHLPNGEISHSRFIGTIHFNANVYLSDVLYIEHFHSNILSVYKIICSLNLEIIFDRDTCFLRDKLNMKMIGLAKV